MAPRLPPLYSSCGEIGPLHVGDRVRNKSDGKKGTLVEDRTFIPLKVIYDDGVESWHNSSSLELSLTVRTVTIKIVGPGDQTAVVKITNYTTVKDVKIEIGEQYNQDPQTVRLMYHNQEMDVKNAEGQLIKITEYVGPDLDGVDDIEAILSFTQHIGQAIPDGVDVDEHQNAVGNQYDLGLDGCFNGMKIAILCLCMEGNYDWARAALEEKGFEIIFWTSMPSIGTFRETMAAAREFWLISSSTSQVTGEYITIVKDFHLSGRGLYIMGDNEPYFVDANAVLAAIFSDSNAHVNLDGNDPGQKLVGPTKVPHTSENATPRGKTSKPGFDAEHPIFTGISTLYEGVTISRVMKEPNSKLRTLMVNSSGYAVTSILHVEGRGRIAIDGGFTRLMHFHWDSARTSRFVKNIAAWLAIKSEW